MKTISMTADQFAASVRQMPAAEVATGMSVFLPSPAAMYQVDADGHVQASSPMAGRVFTVKPGRRMATSGYVLAIVA